MDLSFLAAHTVAKTTKFLIKNALRGGATAAPGYFALQIDRQILKKLAKNLETTILITGTNGKTTTTRLISSFFDDQNRSFIHNRHGSNLERGLISGFLEQTNSQGETEVKTGLFEVDEAALAAVLPKLSPQTIVITNLFRDQLDRYGEVDSVRKIWEKCINNLDEATNLILNADDPSLAFLGKKANCRVSYFGIDDPSVSLTEVPDAVDNVNCPNCQAKLKYSHYYISHQGAYKCPVCHFERPELTFKAEKITLGKQNSEFTLSDEGKIKLHLETPMTGLFSVYNILAGYGALKSLETNLDLFPKIVHDFKPAFGRAEKLEVAGRKVQVTLAKNPTGFNEVVRTFFHKDGQTVLIAINDLIADGRDVSWLWDVDFEKIVDFDIKFFVGGLRAQDMGLRLKYAGIKNYQVIESLSECLDAGLNSIPQNDTLLIVPTYTAMLAFKKLFVAKGVGGEFWED